MIINGLNSIREYKNKSFQHKLFRIYVIYLKYRRLTSLLSNITIENSTADTFCLNKLTTFSRI